jgi:hypothetical protein
MRIAIEVKSTRKVTSDHLKGLRYLREDHPEIGRRIVVCLEEQAWRTEDAIEVLPVGDFLSMLWDGKIISVSEARKG